jgi:heat shock protein HslJ
LLVNLRTTVGVMRILLTGSLALTLLAAANGAQAASAIVPTGVRSLITTHMSYDGQCRPYRVIIEILTAPTNGTLTSEPKDIVVPPETPRAGPQSSQCIGKTVTGAAIFYQPKAGFLGQDSFKYRRSTPDRPGDPAAGEISYTVTVSPAHSSGFPVFMQFDLASINGETYSDRLRTLNIDLAGNGNPMAVGFAGCHGWFAQIATLDHLQISLDSITVTQGQPQGACNAAQQKGEDDFLIALKQASRWRLDQRTLIMSWDNGGNMRLTAHP